jgi:hypothetical protein
MYSNIVRCCVRRSRHGITGVAAATANERRHAAPADEPMVSHSYVMQAHVQSPHAVSLAFRILALHLDAVQISSTAWYRATPRCCAADRCCALHGHTAGMVQMRMLSVYTYPAKHV